MQPAVKDIEVAEQQIFWGVAYRELTKLQDTLYASGWSKYKILKNARSESPIFQKPEEWSHTAGRNLERPYTKKQCFLFAWKSQELCPVNGIILQLKQRLQPSCFWQEKSVPPSCLEQDLIGQPIYILHMQNSLWGDYPVGGSRSRELELKSRMVQYLHLQPNSNVNK